MEPGEFFGALSTRNLELVVYSRTDMERQKKRADKLRAEQHDAIRRSMDVSHLR